MNTEELIKRNRDLTYILGKYTMENEQLKSDITVLRREIDSLKSKIALSQMTKHDPGEEGIEKAAVEDTLRKIKQRTGQEDI